MPKYLPMKPVRAYVGSINFKKKLKGYGGPKRG